MDKFGDVAQAWIENLRSDGYEPRVTSKADCEKLKRFSRTWRRIFKYIGLDPRRGSKLSVFEAGCGRGGQLMQFALNKWRCKGIDCSKEVLRRAEDDVRRASELCGERLDIEFFCGDFLNYTLPRERFDIVFSAGVLEHFLKREERLSVLKKMAYLAKADGHIITIVPNGACLMREDMKTEKLGGYNLPEIDYAPGSLLEEMSQAGLKEAVVIGHNIFNHLLLRKTSSLPFRKLLYLALQSVPLSLLPDRFVFKHAGTLIGIARR
jgi:2-polyprenyl-3-methyl-5-hydroxy-6-metoxy-1,4-benzoquinol methylase